MREERSDIAIENDTAKWFLNEQGDINGLYIGQFKFRCYLTPIQQINANREFREMLGNHQTMVPEHESFMAYALTQLKYRIIEAPPFWTSSIQTSGYPGDIPDENVLSKILDAAISSEIKYKKLLKHKKEEALIKAKEEAEKIIKKRNEDELDDQLD